MSKVKEYLDYLSMEEWQELEKDWDDLSFYKKDFNELMVIIRDETGNCGNAKGIMEKIKLSTHRKS